MRPDQSDRQQADSKPGPKGGGDKGGGRELSLIFLESCKSKQTGGVAAERGGVPSRKEGAAAERGGVRKRGRGGCVAAKRGGVRDGEADVREGGELSFSARGGEREQGEERSRRGRGAGGRGAVIEG